MSLKYLHIQRWDLQQTTNMFAAAVAVSVAPTISPWSHWPAATAQATDAILRHLAHLRHSESVGFLLQPQVKMSYSKFVRKTHSF